MKNVSQNFMKTAITIIFAFLLTTVYGQTDDYKVLLDSAKAMFKNEERLYRLEHEKIDYGKIVTILKKVIELRPDNAEAFYFLGYTYSRINSIDGHDMINMNLELVQKTSEQFEKVNKLAPKYNDEIIILDPYSKLSSEWGSMAMSYWHNKKADSAIWAFNEGKKRGGFGNFILELNKKVLDACSQNSILITSGDNSTIPLWYLQIAEGYRKDVSVIDISLLNSTWYPAYLSKNKIVTFDLPDEILDTIEFIKWTDSTITINNFSWTIKPSYYDQYLLRGDRVFLSLLKQNKFQRDLYFTIGFMEESILCLKDYLTNFMVVDKLTIPRNLIQIDFDYEKSITEILQFSEKLNPCSIDEIRIYDNFRYNLFVKVNYYIENNEKIKARKLMKLLDKYADEKKFPYADKKGKEYADFLRQRL